MTHKAWQYKLKNLSLQLSGLTVCVVLCFSLYSSTTHYSPVLRYYLLQEELASSYEGLWPAAKDGSDLALDALAKLAEAYEDIYWLEKAASLNSLYAQLALGRLSEGETQIQWWRRAASNGHGPSQFELSLSVESTKQRIRYLEQAALNEYAPAIIALSKYYYEENDASNALRWLGKASKYDHSNIFRMAKMLWYQGNYLEATKTFKHASEKDYVAKAYYSTIQNTPRQALSALTKAAPLPNSCAQQLQFVATSLNSAVQATTFKKQFEKDDRLARLPICIKPVIWLDDNELECKLDEQRQKCDLTALATRSFTPSYTHLVFFLNEGKGYVHNGIMYLDEADKYTVFVHELAHFVGFVDEYAVASSLASQYCYAGSAPNLLVSADTNLYQNDMFRKWQGYTKHVNVTDEMASAPNASGLNLPIEVGPSRTCASLDLQSYKPSNELTFMEYHDTNNIPPLYLMMWRDLLTQRHQSIVVSETFKQLAQEAGEVNSAAYWANF